MNNDEMLPHPPPLAMGFDIMNDTDDGTHAHRAPRTAHRTDCSAQPAGSVLPRQFTIRQLQLRRLLLPQPTLRLRRLPRRTLRLRRLPRRTLRLRRLLPRRTMRLQRLLLLPQLTLRRLLLPQLTLRLWWPSTNAACGSSGRR